MKVFIQVQLCKYKMKQSMRNILINFIKFLLINRENIFLKNNKFIGMCFDVGNMILFLLYNKMYIIKLDHRKEQNGQSLGQHTDKLALLKQRNPQFKRFYKKNSFISQRDYDSQADEQFQDKKYTVSFSKMMNKILHRIYRRNNFFKTEGNQENPSTNPQEKPQEEVSHLTQSLDYPNRKNKTFYQHNKLKIKGVGRKQNESNLLKKQNRIKMLSKTSSSFTKTKQLEKDQFNKTKSYSSAVTSINKFAENYKQNSFKLNNTRYSPKEFSRLMVEESIKVESFVPRITVKENYQQIHQLMKGNMQSKQNKIEIGKKNFHKRMMERQKNIEKKFHQQTQNISRNIKEKSRSYDLELLEKASLKDHIQPWITNEEYNEQIFKLSKKHPY